MPTDLYYFSATGNSLWIAREISRILDNSTITSIAKVHQSVSDIQGENIGIVCPIYMYNMPHIVADFIRKISQVEYLFIVFAGAGKLGNGIKEAVKLCNSRGITISSLFNIPMPSNYTPYGCPSNEKKNGLYEQARKKIDTVATTVKNRGQYIDQSNTSAFNAYIFPGLLYSMGYSRISGMDNQFAADGNCNVCRMCEKVCPVNNITIENDRPVWNNNCQQCYACLQWCPQQAIQAGKKTIGKPRYHHPDVTVKDIIDSAGSQAQM